VPEDCVDVVIEPADEPDDSVMTTDALRNTLCGLNAQMYVDDTVLHYVGPRLDDDDLILIAIKHHHDLLVEMFTFAPGRRCVVETCSRLRDAGSTVCIDHVQGEAGTVS